MKTHLLRRLLLLASLTASPVCAEPDSFIWIDVSIKAIVNPATGLTPPQAPAGSPATAFFNDAALLECFTEMNRWLANTYRGYRLRPVDSEMNGSLFPRIGAKDDTNGPSKWYDTNLKGGGDPPNPNPALFRDAIQANKALYKWNDNAVNLYFNNAGWSSANLPPGATGLMQSGYSIFITDLTGSQRVAANYKISGNLLHEVGHFFGLYHTFGKNDSDTNDYIDDTAPDPGGYADGRNETSVRNTIAQFNYTKNFSQLNNAEKTLVDNTANNAMSYIQLFYDDPPQGKVLSDAERFGPTRFVFTEKQMDVWADWANHPDRRMTASGTMRFIDASADFAGFGTSASPMKTLEAGITFASNTGSDILMLRPGTYTSSTISKPVTIRATRQGSVQIQKP